VEAAEAAYREASRLGHEPQPGLALLRLAQGKRDAAAASLARALAEATEPLARAALLPAAVEVALAAGEIEEAEAACRELAGIAERFESPMLQATSLHARGLVELARGDARAALVPLRGATQSWSELEIPYEAARARVALGRACGELGDADSAELELEAAREVFVHLGAQPDVARVDALLRARAGRDAHGLTPRELEVLRLVAAGASNRQIAAELVLSERTVDRHVSNLYAKLRVSSRAAATAAAYREGLV
jgi:ATP/maltotriose-dependent transcriptional regulator MalT